MLLGLKSDNLHGLRQNWVQQRVPNFYAIISQICCPCREKTYKVPIWVYQGVPRRSPTAVQAWQPWPLWEPSP